MGKWTEVEWRLRAGSAFGSIGRSVSGQWCVIKLVWGFDVEQKVRFRHGRRVQGARGLLRPERRVGPIALGLEPVEKLEDVAELDVEVSSISHVRRRGAVRKHIRERDYDRGSPAVGGRVSVVRCARLVSRHRALAVLCGG